MNVTMLLLTIATVVLAGGSLWAAVYYGRRAVSEARNANALASERSVVEWQIERWHEDNPGHFYVYNAGHDAAHDVSLLAWDGQDRVEVTTKALEPPPGDRHPTLGPPEYYIEFRLPERERNGPTPEPGPPPRIPTPGPPMGAMGDYFAEIERQQDEMTAGLIAERERSQVWVRITWRSELGRWSTVEVQTG